jgi:hypothetical protein
VRRPAFVAACVPIALKAGLIALGGTAPLWSWIPWLAVAAVIWVEEPRWRGDTP